MSGPITWFDAVLLWCGYGVVAGAALLGTVLALAMMITHGAQRMFFAGEIVQAIVHLRRERKCRKSWEPLEERSNPPPPKTPRPGGHSADRHVNADDVRPPRGGDAVQPGRFRVKPWASDPNPPTFKP